MSQATLAKHLKAIGLTLAAAAFVLSTQAQAAGPKCGERATLIKVLSDKYKEKPRALGLSSKGTAMFEIYTSKTGTWTIVMTTTAGATCIMAAGHSWEDAFEIAEGPQS